MNKLIKFKIITLAVVLQGILPDNAFSQFTEFYRPDCGQYMGCYSSIAFADKMSGFCKEDIFISPSSGYTLEIFKTLDGGETWEHQRGDNNDKWVSFGLFFAEDSETCFFDAGEWPCESLIRLSNEGYYSYDYLNCKGIYLREMTKLNDSVFHLVGWRYQYPGYDSNYLYRIETDSVRELYGIDVNSLQMFKAVFTDPDTGFVIAQLVSSQEYIIRRTIDAGITWENCFYADSLEITDIAFFNHSTGIISLSGGLLFRTEDAGTTWTSILLNTDKKINTLSLVNEDIGYCGGETGIFYESLDRGLSWNIIPFSENIIKLQMIEQGFGYLTTDKNSREHFYRYANQEGVDNLQCDSEISIFPNPTKGSIELELRNGIATSLNIKLTNLIGEAIALFPGVGNNFQIDLSDYPSGIYFLMINEGEHYYTKKIIRQ